MLAVLPWWLLAQDRLLAAASKLPGLSPAALCTSLGYHALALAAGLIGIALAARITGTSVRAKMALAVAVGAAPALIVGRSLITGPWISQQPWATGLPWVLALGSALGFALWIWIAHGLRTTDERPARIGRLSLLAAPLVLLPIADAALQPAGFAEFHLWLYGVHVAALLGLGTILGARWTAARRGTSAAIACAALFAMACSGLAISPNEAMRAELVMGSRTVGRMVRALGQRSSSRLRAVLELPPVAAAPEDPKGLAGPRRARANILLITVDALRADAVWPEVDEGDHPASPEDAPFLNSWIQQGVVFRHAYAPASTTANSMPLIFHGFNMAENPYLFGQKLGPRMADTGRETIAVANEYFGPDFPGGLPWLLEGFELVQLYENTEQQDAVPDLLEALDDVGAGTDERPVFAWFHLFAIHEPGFAQKRLTKVHGSWPDRYREGLRWTDGQLEQLHRGLEQRGLLDDTVIVLTADHGEGLGDNGVSRHGTTIYEEELRVPLVFFIPGIQPRIVEDTVGVIDVVPTLLHLAGGRSQERLAGRSLASAFDGGALEARDYQIINRTTDMVGLVRGRHKLVYDGEADTMQLFDLAADPQEESNLYTGQSALDRGFTTRLIRAFPHHFQAELDDEYNAALVVERLRGLGDDCSLEDLEFFVGLALARGTRSLVGEVEDVGTRMEDVERKSLVARRLRTHWALTR